MFRFIQKNLTCLHLFFFRLKQVEIKGKVVLSASSMDIGFKQLLHFNCWHFIQV
jgi:hypothetical protein